MSYLDSLYSEKERYITLREKVREVAKNLDSVISKFDEPIVNTKLNFKIDDFSPLSKKLESVKLNLVSKKSTLSGSVINSINEKIQYYEKEIEEELARIEELKKKLEKLFKDKNFK